MIKADLGGFLPAIITFVVLLLLVYAYRPDVGGYSFGWEYGNIAASIVQGQGYSQPFEGSEKATAWMLPVTTLIYASVFTLFGMKTPSAMWACVLLSCLLWSCCAYYLYQSARLISRELALLAIVLLWVYLVLHKVTVKSLADFALINLLSVMTIYHLYYYLEYGRKYGGLLLLALLLPLVSPGLFLAFVLILASRFGRLLIAARRKHGQKISFSQILYLGLASVVVMMVWGYRNYQVLGKFIPSKSNFWYEFYQANMADDDGVVGPRTFRTYHPSAHGQYRSIYDSLGEIDFLELMKQRSKAEFTLSNYVRRVGNRAEFAFIKSREINLKLPADTSSLTLLDKELLHRKGLVQSGEWIALDMDSETFTNTIKSIDLEEEKALVSDWKAKKKVFNKQAEENIFNLARENSLSLIPFLCMILGMVVRHIRRNRLFQLVVAIYIIQLLPYLLISHYIRYQYYGLALQVLIVFIPLSYFINVSLDRLLNNQTRQTLWLRKKIK